METTGTAVIDNATASARVTGLSTRLIAIVCVVPLRIGTGA
jgi:hypothetical protein